MSKHKNKNRTPKKTFLDAMREIEPSLTEDNLFSEIYDNALEIEDVGYEDINAAYADVDSDMMTSDTVIFSKIGNKYLVLFDRDDYTSAEADVESIRPLRQAGPSRQPLKLESAVRVCQGSYKHLCQKGALCRGRLTVGQQLAKLPSRKSRHVSSNLTLCAICLLVRVVDEIGPENRRWETVRRFESFSKRHCPHSVRYPCR